MEKLIIEGGTPLNGTVAVNGAKNAAVAILPATVLINGKCKIENGKTPQNIDCGAFGHRGGGFALYFGKTPRIQVSASALFGR